VREASHVHLAHPPMQIRIHRTTHTVAATQEQPAAQPGGATHNRHNSNGNGLVIRVNQWIGDRQPESCTTSNAALRVAAMSPLACGAAAAATAAAAAV